jgi:hypothetical protein
MFWSECCRGKKLEGECGDKKKIGAANGQANEAVQRQVYFRSQRMCLIFLNFKQVQTDYGTVETVEKERSEKAQKGSTNVMIVIGILDRNWNEGLSIILEIYLILEL